MSRHDDLPRSEKNSNLGINIPSTTNGTVFNSNMESSLSFTASEHHEDRSVSLNRIKQIFMDFWGHVDRVLSAVHLADCRQPPDTCSDGEITSQRSDDDETISSSGASILPTVPVTDKNNVSDVMVCEETVKITLRNLMALCQSTDTISPQTEEEFPKNGSVSEDEGRSVTDRSKRVYKEDDHFLDYLSMQCTSLSCIHHSSPIELNRKGPSTKAAWLPSSKIPILSPDSTTDETSPIRFIRILSKSPRPGTHLSSLFCGKNVSQKGSLEMKSDASDPFTEQSEEASWFNRPDSYYNSIFTKEEMKQIPTPELFEKLRESVPVKPARPDVRKNWEECNSLDTEYCTFTDYTPQHGDGYSRYVKEIEIGVGMFHTDTTNLLRRYIF